MWVNSIYPCHDPFIFCDSLDVQDQHQPIIPCDGLNWRQVQDPDDPLHPIFSIIQDTDVTFAHESLYHCYSLMNLPASLHPTHVVFHPQEHQASMATEVTPTPDLSTMTQSLPSLSQTNLQTLQTGIQTLLQTPDDANHSKMSSLPVLPAADVFDDFSN